MAMYVKFNFGPDNTWHIGNKDTASLRDSASVVESVQANGQELEYIRAKFVGLPQHVGRVSTWHGDFAKFIVANL